MGKESVSTIESIGDSYYNFCKNTKSYIPWILFFLYVAALCGMGAWYYTTFNGNWSIITVSVGLVMLVIALTFIMLMFLTTLIGISDGEKAAFWEVVEPDIENNVLNREFSISTSHGPIRYIVRSINHKRRQPFDDVILNVDVGFISTFSIPVVVNSIGSNEISVCMYVNGLSAHPYIRTISTSQSISTGDRSYTILIEGFEVVDES